MSVNFTLKSGRLVARAAALAGMFALASAFAAAPAVAKPSAQQQIEAFVACLQLNGKEWRAQCGTPTLPYSFNTAYHRGIEGRSNRCKGGAGN